MARQTHTIERLVSPVADSDLRALAQLLVDAVESGAAVSFLAPLTLERAEDWWRKATSATHSGAIFLVARDAEGIVGSVQLHPSWAPNQPHRAEIAKLLVHRRSRRTGLATQLMQTVEDAARRAGFGLLTLDTKRGDAAEYLYRQIGWTAVGTIPRYALDPNGTPHDAVIFYKELNQADESRAGARSMPTILWRRLDTPGHDACRLDGNDEGWRLEGTAVFRHDDVPAQVHYRVVCDRAWRTQRGEVRGWLGKKSIEFAIARAGDGVWTVNGAVVRGLENHVDLDLGFTPATNLPQLRRVALAEGKAADVPVAWFDLSSERLQVLPQRYERRNEMTYWYEAPSVPYEGLLEVSPTGFIRRYPGLWEAEVAE